MNVAYVHHHLRPGGVTRVILDELESLEGKVRMLVLTGEPPPFPARFPWTLVPELAYDAERTFAATPAELARSIAVSVNDAWGSEPCVLHVHNPTLQKNRSLLNALNILREKGARLLLHVHDFAEDGRPELYSPQEYPTGCHYAVINRRDFRVLSSCGIGEEGLHYIPDAVRPLLAPDPGRPPDPRRRSEGLVLYAARAIRRKNIGEAVLLSSFLPRGRTLGVTLEPTGALDRRSLQDWKRFVRDENLGVLFGLGRPEGIGALAAEASAFVTTSVKEGFGLSYLEPWTAGRALFGRLLEDVCADFVEKGLRLDHLYRSLRVPLDAFDRGAFERKWRTCYAERLRKYGMEPDREKAEAFLNGLRGEGNVDFGMLSEDLQREVIRKTLDKGRVRTGLAERNPFLENPFDDPAVFGVVEANRAIVTKEFSLERTAVTLLDVYQKVLNRQVDHAIDRTALVSAFNAPERNLLLLCPSSYE